MIQTLTRLDNEVTRTLKIAQTRFPSHSFPEPSVKMDLTGKCAGCYNSKGVRIRFNLDLMLENKENFINETVAHEVAHYVVDVINPNSKPHGSTWRAIMKLFGINNPRVCHDYEIPEVIRHKQLYVYQCSCKQHFFTKRRHNYARKGVSYICDTCKSNCRYVGKKET